jgi:AcrR family transcriptional regulator
MSTTAPPAAERRRRDPVQERSHDTVARIQAAAARLLAGGTAAQSLTTAQIAAAAGLSVGALYRFFPDKQAVIDAIALHHLEAFQDSLAALLVADLPETPSAFLGATLDAFAAYLAAHADFRALAYGPAGRAISPAVFEAQAGAGEMAALIRSVLEDMFGLAPGEDFDFRLRIAAEIGDRLIGHAFARDDPAARRRVLGEAKHIIVTYLFGSDCGRQLRRSGL